MNPKSPNNIYMLVAMRPHITGHMRHTASAKRHKKSKRIKKIQLGMNSLIHGPGSSVASAEHAFLFLVATFALRMRSLITLKAVFVVLLLFSFSAPVFVSFDNFDDLAFLSVDATLVALPVLLFSFFCFPFGSSSTCASKRCGTSTIARPPTISR